MRLAVRLFAAIGVVAVAATTSVLALDVFGRGVFGRRASRSDDVAASTRLGLYSFGPALPAQPSWLVDDTGLRAPDQLVLRARRVDADHATFDAGHVPDGFDHQSLHVELERGASGWQVRDCIVTSTDSGDRYEVGMSELAGSLGINADIDAANAIRCSFRLCGEIQPRRGSTMLSGSCFARF